MDFFLPSTPACYHCLRAENSTAPTLFLPVSARGTTPPPQRPAIGTPRLHPEEGGPCRSAPPLTPAGGGRAPPRAPAATSALPGRGRGQARRLVRDVAGGLRAARRLLLFSPRAPTAAASFPGASGSGGRGAASERAADRGGRRRGGGRRERPLTVSNSPQREPGQRGRGESARVTKERARGGSGRPWPTRISSSTSSSGTQVSGGSRGRAERARGPAPRSHFRSAGVADVVAACGEAAPRPCARPRPGPPPAARPRGPPPSLRRARGSARGIRRAGERLSPRGPRIDAAPACGRASGAAVPCLLCGPRRCRPRLRMLSGPLRCHSVLPERNGKPHLFFD